MIRPLENDPKTLRNGPARAHLVETTDIGDLRFYQLLGHQLVGLSKSPHRT